MPAAAASAPHTPCILDYLRSVPPNNPADFTLCGNVFNTRQHGASLSFHDLRTPTCACSVQVILSPAHLRGGAASCDALAPLLRFATCEVSGPLEAAQGQLSLHARAVTLQRVHAPPAAGGATAVQRVLCACAAGLLSREEAGAALDCAPEALAALLACQAAGDRYRLKQALLARSRALAGLPPGRPCGRQRAPLHARSDLAALAAAEAALPAAAPTPGAGAWGGAAAAPPAHAAAEDPLHPVHNLPPTAGACARALPANHGERSGASAGGTVQAGPCLPPRAQRSREQYAHHKKAPQIAWFLEALAPLLQQLTAARRRGGDGGGGGGGGGDCCCPPLSLVDVGGGRGDLALAVTARFPGVRTTVIDVNESSLAAGRARAAELGLQDRIHFWAADALALAESGALARADADLFFGLHTCGGLSDAVIALAVSVARPFLIVPCCYNKNGALVARCAGLGLAVDPAAARAATASAASAGAGVEAEGEAEEEDEDAHEEEDGEVTNGALCSAPADVGLLQHRVLCKLAESSDRAISVRASTVLNARRLLAVQPQATACGLMLQAVTAFDASASARNIALMASPAQGQ